MKLTKFHKILKFERYDWLKKYIDFNIDQRKNADNKSKKDFFKLRVNPIPVGVG